MENKTGLSSITYPKDAVRWYLADGDTMENVVGIRGKAVDAYDLDNDKDADISLVTAYSASTILYENLGDLTFRVWDTICPVKGNNRSNYMDFCDFNDDGVTDILAYSFFVAQNGRYKGEFYVMWGNSDGFITVLSPHKNDTLRKTDILNIKWKDNFEDLVRIDLISNSGIVTTIVDSTRSDGSFSWAIPDTIATGNYVVKITNLDNDTLVGFSDSTFAIVDYKLILNVKNGSGTGRYDSGTVVDIVADSVDDVDMVFGSWIGDASGVADINNPTTTITLKRDASIEIVNGIKLPSPQFRANKYSEGDVELDKSGNVHFSSHQSDNWADYDFVASYTGNYKMRYRFRLQYPGENFFSICDITYDSLNTTPLGIFGSKSNAMIWKNDTGTIFLDKGYHKLRITVIRSIFLLDWIDFDSLSEVVAINQNDALPQKFTLQIQKGLLKYTIASLSGAVKQPVEIVLHDLHGRNIAVLLKDDMVAGNYTLQVDTFEKEISDGVYIITLTCGINRAALQFIRNR